MTLQRRTVLGLMGAAALAGVAGVAEAGKAKGTAATLDLADREQLALAYRKMAFSADDSLAFWWLRGTRYGVVDSVATPMWDMHVGAWMRTRDLDGGAFEVTMVNANLYTAPGGTDLIKGVRNPYTGQELTFPSYELKAMTSRHDRDGGSAFGFKPPGMKTTVESGIGPAWIDGDDLVINGDMVLHAYPEADKPGAKPMHVNDWSTYIASLADVANPRVRNAAAAHYFNDINSWPAWMQMGDLPGSYVSRAFGRKVFAYDRMPALFRKLMADRYPAVAKDPLALLSG